MVLTIGAVFVSSLGRWLSKNIDRFRKTARQPNIRTAVVAHLYYLDILPEIIRCHEALPGGTVLHLTVPDDRFEEASQLIKRNTAALLHRCQNRGRDIAPFMVLLNDGIFDEYDAVLKLHTKRSPHLNDGEIRRKLLFSMLAGNRNQISRALAFFEEADTGIIGWRASYRDALPYWMSNELRVRAIAARMSAPPEVVGLGFFEGSMFWFRPAALNRLRALQLRPDDFEPEARQLDGMLHHAIERCFTISARADGFNVRDMGGSVLD